MRGRRLRLGLERRHVSAAAQKAGEQLTVTMIADLEIGDRLPVLTRLAGLGAGLRLPGWVIGEWARLALVIEARAMELPPFWGVDELLEQARVQLDVGQSVAAAAAAVRAAEICDGPLGEQAQLLSGWALVDLQFQALAGELAQSVFEVGSDELVRAEAATLLAQVAVLDGRPRIAERWIECALSESPIIPPWLSSRMALVRGGIDLLRDRPHDSIERLGALAGQSRRGERRRLYRDAILIMVEALRKQNRFKDARFWESMLADPPRRRPIA